jgi:peptidoglycan/LPS O-acetylase OafA/YrhL
VALAVGNQFSLAVLAVAILPLMLWVAPVRPRAVLVIWVTAIAVAATLIFASYWFEPTLFWQGLLHARWFDFEPMAVLAPVSYRSIEHSIIAGSPPLMLALPVALMTYLGWKRARYFGNTLPLLIAGLLVAMLVCSPGFRGQGFSIAMLVFLFVFVAGVFSDLLQTERSMLVSAGLWGLMGVSAMENIRRLLRLA